MIEREFDDYLALLRGLLRLRKKQCDAIADELRDHMDARLEDLLAEGIPREKAVQIALEEFGDAAGVGQAFLELNRTNQRRWNMKITAASLLTCTALGLAAMAFWPGGGPEVSNKAMAQIGGGAPGPGGGVAPGGPPPGMPQVTERSKEENNQATALKLAQVQQNFDIQQVQLDEFGKLIGDMCQVNVIVDRAKMEEAGVETSKALEISLKNVRIDTALELTLKQLGNCGYYIHDGIVMITSQEALANVTEVRVYNVADLVYLDTAWPLDPSHGPGGAPGMMGGMGTGMGMGASGGMGGMPGASGSMAPGGYGGYGGAGGMPGGPGGMGPGGPPGGMKGGPPGGFGGGEGSSGAGGPGGIGGVGGPPGGGFPGSGAGPGGSGAPGGFGAPGGGGRPGPGGPGAGGPSGGSGFGGGRPGGSGGGEGASFEGTGAAEGAPSGGGSAGALEGGASGGGGAIPAAGGGESAGPTSGLGMIETISETPNAVLAQMGGGGLGGSGGAPPGGMMGGGGGGGMGGGLPPKYFSKEPKSYTPEERRTVDLMQAITSAVEWETWATNGNGGVGEVQPFEGLLIIRNTPKAHQGIEMLLQQIRTARLTPRGGIGGLGGGVGGMGGPGMGGMGGGMFSIEGR
jgi:hypothetical protein